MTPTLEEVIARLNDLEIEISINPKMELKPPRGKDICWVTSELTEDELVVLRERRNDVIRVAIARDLLLEADQVVFPRNENDKVVLGSPEYNHAALRVRMLRQEALMLTPLGLRWSTISRRRNIPVLFGREHPSNDRFSPKFREDTDESPMKGDFDPTARPYQRMGEPADLDALLGDEIDPDPQTIVDTRRHLFRSQHTEQAYDPEPEELTA